MGLGKTLSMIALVTSDQDSDAEISRADELHSTLIIAPLNGKTTSSSLSRRLILLTFHDSARSVGIASETVNIRWF
jgi:hypothetical protein